MAEPLNTANLDEILNELESLAKQSAPVSLVIGASLEKLQRVLGAKSSVWAVPMGRGKWVAMSAEGDVSRTEIEGWLCDQLCDPSSAAPSIQATPYRWMHLVDEKDTSKGCLVFDFLASESSPVEERLIVVEAFAEIILLAILRQRDCFVSRDWRTICAALRVLPAGHQLLESGQLLVNELRKLARADRVSLVKLHSSTCARVYATSSVMSFERTSDALLAIERYVASGLNCDNADGPSLLTNSDGQPSKFSNLLPTDCQSESPTADTLVRFPFVLQIPLLSAPQSALTNTLDSRISWCMVLEWNSSEQFHDFAPLIGLIQDYSSSLWEEQVHWSRVPRISRRIAQWRNGQRQLRGRRFTWIIVWVCILFGSYAVNRPVNLEIEANGTLQPEFQRMVFATHDGYVDKLMVKDGQQVKEGQIVATLRSPALESRIEEIAGELRTLGEKRSGLLVAENQIQTSDQTAALSQSRIAAEIRELDARQTSLKAIVKLLDSERAKLELRSPIDGMIVASELQRNLAARPVRRGEALLKVVAIDGPWRIEASVADRDSAYVRRLSSLDLPPRRETQIGLVRIVLTAKPNEVFSGRLHWIASATRNVEGIGPSVDVHIAVDQLMVGRGQLGATTIARITCERQPWWFVQLRPLLESIQRRFWF